MAILLNLVKILLIYSYNVDYFLSYTLIIFIWRTLINHKHNSSEVGVHVGGPVNVSKTDLVRRTSDNGRVRKLYQ